jgi:hypothetical protein
VNPLDNFLLRFKALLNNSGSEKKAFIEAARKVALIDFSDKEVEVKDGVVSIHASPLFKNEIFMRKKAILSELQAQNIKTIRDIR